MEWDWTYFFLGIIAWPFIKLLARAINHAVVEHRQKRFLKLVDVLFADDSKITFIALETSDKRAMAKLERQIRADFDIPDKEDLDRDSGFDGNLRRSPARDRQDPPR